MTRYCYWVREDQQAEVFLACTDCRDVTNDDLIDIARQELENAGGTAEGGYFEVVDKDGIPVDEY